MRLAVLSDGAWGTALAIMLSRGGHDVRLWGPFPDYLRTMAESRANPRYLPDVALPADVALEPDLGTAVTAADVIILASPAQYMRSVLKHLSTVRPPADACYVNVAKGIETGTLMRIQEVVADVLGPVSYAVLSGPSHAEEVARGIPTAVVAASAERPRADHIRDFFMTDRFRVYTSTDVVGVELGGALKNVLALAAGICDGMGFGDNTKAALMTRGIVEIARLGQALGGQPQTFSGLSGTGDLIVTCMSRHSRNRHVGEELGRGKRLDDIIAAMGGQVAEGVTTARSAYHLARDMDVATPIIDQVYAALYAGRDPRDAVTDLMTRTPKSEHR